MICKLQAKIPYFTMVNSQAYHSLLVGNALLSAKIIATVEAYSHLQNVIVNFKLSLVLEEEMVEWKGSVLIFKVSLDVRLVLSICA